MDPRNTPQGTLSQIDSPLVQGSPMPLATAAPAATLNDGEDTSLTPGANTLANPAGPQVPYGASLGSMIMGKGFNMSSLPAVSSPHVNKIGDAIQKTITENPQAAAQPGGVMRAVVAGGLQALSGALTGLGDVSTAPVPPGGGPLTGVTRTLENRNRRVAGEKQQQFENTEKKRLDDANIAHAQMQTLHEKVAARIAGNDALEKSQASDQGLADSFDSVNTPVLANGLTDAQLHDWMKNERTKGADSQLPNAIALIDHFEREKSDDKDTPDTLTPIWKIYGKGEDVSVGSKNAELINKYLPQSQLLAEDTKLAASSLISLVKQAQLRQTQDANREKLANENAKNKNEAAKFEQEAKDKKEHDQFGQDIAPTMNKYGQDPLKALDAMSKNQTPEAVEMARKIQTYYGPTLIDTMKKNAEEARHNKEEEDIKRAQKQTFQGDVKATTPKEFYDSLQPGEQSVVDLIHSGRAPIQSPAYLLARKPEVLEAVERAYPGEFDASKVSGYQKMYIDYTSNGSKTSGGQLSAGATALGHLAELKKINDENTIAVHNPATASYKRYNNLLDTVADELGTFYGEPKTNEVIQSKKATLGGLLNRDAAILEQAKAMGVKFDSLENKWKEGAPSKAYEAQMPNISLEAKKTRAALDPEYAAKHPELGVKPTQQAGPTAPANAGAPDGKVYMQIADPKSPGGIRYMYVDKAKQPDAEKLGAKVVQ